MDKDFKKEIKLINRDLAYKGSILSIYRDEVEIAGKTYFFDYISHTNASAILPIMPNGDILLVRQYRLAVNKWTLEIPAGKADSDDEDPIICAKRELEEETGYKSDDMEYLVTINGAMGMCKSICTVYLAKNLQKGHIHFDENEETKVEIWKVEDLKKEIFSGNIVDGKTITALFAYLSKYGKN